MALKTKRVCQRCIGRSKYPSYILRGKAMDACPRCGYAYFLGCCDGNLRLDCHCMDYLLTGCPLLLAINSPSFAANRPLKEV